MRPGIAVVVLMALAVASPAAASPEAHGTANADIVITDTSEGSPAQPGAGTTAPTRPVYAYWVIVYTPAGFCRERRFSTDQAEADAYNYVYGLRAAEANELT